MFATFTHAVSRVYGTSVSLAPSSSTLCPAHYISYNGPLSEGTLSRVKLSCSYILLKFGVACVVFP